MMTNNYTVCPECLWMLGKDVPYPCICNRMTLWEVLSYHGIVEEEEFVQTGNGTVAQRLQELEEEE